MKSNTVEAMLFPGFRNDQAREALGSLAVGIAQYNGVEHYDAIIAEGISARIPALVIAGVYKNIVHLEEAPSVVTLLPYQKAQIPQTFISDNMLQSRVLLVTEYASSGMAVESVTEDISSLGIRKDKIDIATVVSTQDAQEELRAWAHPKQMLFLNEPYTDSRLYLWYYTLKNKSARAQSESLATSENTFPFDRLPLEQKNELRAKVADEIQHVIALYSES